MTTRQTPPLRDFRDRVIWAWEEALHIIDADNLRLVCLLLGTTMIMWGGIGLYRQSDLAWFATGFALEFSPWLWGVHNICYGYGLIHVSLHHLPKHRSVFLGSWGAIIWAWVMLGRPNSTVSSGVSLNAAIVIVSLILIYKAGRK